MQNLKKNCNLASNEQNNISHDIHSTHKSQNQATKQMANKKTDFCELQHSKHHEALLSEN